MNTSKLENPKLVVPHGAMESTVSCPHFTDQHSSVWNVRWHTRAHEACEGESPGLDASLLLSNDMSFIR